MRSEQGGGLPRARAPAGLLWASAQTWDSPHGAGVTCVNKPRTRPLARPRAIERARFSHLRRFVAGNMASGESFFLNKKTFIFEGTPSFDKTRKIGKSTKPKNNSQGSPHQHNARSAAAFGAARVRTGEALIMRPPPLCNCPISQPPHRSCPVANAAPGQPFASTGPNSLRAPGPRGGG